MRATLEVHVKELTVVWPAFMPSLVSKQIHSKTRSFSVAEPCAREGGDTRFLAGALDRFSTLGFLGGRPLGAIAV